MMGYDEVMSMLGELSDEDRVRIDQIKVAIFNGLPIKIKDHAIYTTQGGVDEQIKSFTGPQGFVYVWKKVGRGYEMTKTLVDTAS